MYRRIIENRGFGRKKDNRNSKQTTAPTGLSDGAKAVPVVVLLAMSPMNATPQTAQMLEQLNDKNTVEMYSQLPQIDAPNALEIAQVPQKTKINPPPKNKYGEPLAEKVCSPDVYVNSEKFKGLDGKNYYLIYNRYKNAPNDEVHSLFIVPEDYDESDMGMKGYKPYPLRIYSIVNHNNKYLSVRLYQNLAVGWNCDEMQLPDEIIDKVLDIVANEDKNYKYNPGEIPIKLIKSDDDEMDPHGWYGKESKYW